MKHRIFVSYSRRDSEIVGPLVGFLRIAASDVFRDVDNIPLGLEWRAVLAEAIETCDAFVLFWCCHSAVSEEVANECTRAIQTNKRLIPVLIDKTALPPNLSKYQGINLSDILGSHEGMIEYEIPGLLPGPTKTERGWGIIVPNGRDMLDASVHLKYSLVAVFGESE